MRVHNKKVVCELLLHAILLPILRNVQPSDDVSLIGL